MGDRATTELITSEGSIYVYTHWGGGAAPGVAQEAILASFPRLNDQPYAVHIILDVLMRATRDLTTGCGVSLRMRSEDEYNDDKPSVVINLPERKLTVWRNGKATVTRFGDIKLGLDKTKNPD